MYPLIDKVKSTIKTNKLIDRGDHIIVGVSGGPDSICLLHVLYCLSTDLRIKITAVHINHKMRPLEAEKDQRYTEAFCKNLGINYRSFVFDVPALSKEQGLSSEEVGRQVRYKAFYEVKAEVGGQKIAVAQNQNDQAETLLMRIIRGTGTSGLSGMDYIREGTIIRPLLDVSRDEIETYCSANKLNPQIDLTNLLPIYTRNKIRLELIPYLQKNYNENIVQGLSRLSGIAREDKDFINKVVDEVIAQKAIIVREDNITGDIKKITVPCSAINSEHPAVSKRMIIRIFGMMGLVQDIQSVHLESALSLIRIAATSLSTDFPGGYSLRISYGLAEFLPRKKGLASTELGKLKEQLINAEDLIERKSSKYQQYFDYDSILKSGSEITLRTRKRGDSFSPLGMMGSKKIKDYLIDEKIPREQRDSIPLVCMGTEVLWIIGHRISEKYKITPETKTILMLEYSKEV